MTACLFVCATNCKYGFNVYNCDDVQRTFWCKWPIHDLFELTMFPNLLKVEDTYYLQLFIIK